MGDQCVNIAKLVPLCGCEPAKDKDVLEAIERMGRLARTSVAMAKAGFKTRHVALGKELVRQDAEIAQLNRAICNRAVEIGDDLEVREWAMFMILVCATIPL